MNVIDEDMKPYKSILLEDKVVDTLLDLEKLDEITIIKFGTSPCTDDIHERRENSPENYYNRWQPDHSGSADGLHGG